MANIRLVLACLLVGCIDVARAACPYGPEQCKPGLVWRDAVAGDHVCVSGDVHAQAIDDNSHAAERKLPGSDTCLAGFVWREATTSDHVCVTVPVRSATWADNTAGPSRRDPACAAGVNIQGNIAYSEPGRAEPRPVAGAEIELWSCNNWFGPSCGWNRLEGGKTDDQGHYSWSLAGPRDPRDWYQVRAYARNTAAIVWQQDTASNYWTDVLPQAVQAAPGSSVVDISRTFGSTGGELFASQHFNAAQKLLPARAFALRFRDSSEADTLGRVIVAPALINGGLAGC